jgi:hypothetical protein
MRCLTPMFRVSTVVVSLALASFVTIGGCGGGDGDDGGEPLYIVGNWSGPMTHRIIDNNNHTDTTITYTIIFFILSQDGRDVSGKMQLRDPSHVGNLYGTMSGNRFRGVRTGTHTVQIEFTVNGNILTGTFRFVGDGLDETGTYTCTKL